MHKKLGIPETEVPVLRDYYFRQFGTTLRGLISDFQVDAEEYLQFVHDIQLEDYIHPDESLQKMIISLPQKKFVFTNADSRHAHRVLSFLQLDSLF